MNGSCTPRAISPLRITEVVLQTESFRRNSRGVTIDPDDFVAKFRSAMSQADLVRIP